MKGQRIVELDQDLKEQYKEQVQIEDMMRKTEQFREWQGELDNLLRNVDRNEKTLSNQILEMRSISKDMWRGMLRKRIDEVLTDLRERTNLLENKKNQKTITDKLIDDIKVAIYERSCPLCEQAINENALENLQRRIQDTSSHTGLSEDEKTELFQAKNRIEVLKYMLHDSVRSKVRAIENQITMLSVDIDSDKQKIQELQQRAAEYSGDYDSIRELPINYSKIMQKINNLTASKKGENEKLEDLKLRRDQLMTQIRKLASGADLKEATRKLDLCEQIYQLFESGVSEYRDELRSNVEKDATDLFVSIAGDPDYVSLKINDNYGLSIVHRTGSLVPGRSSGYEHVVALSLIGTLHKNAPLQGPIIMDSPFFRLDKTHKKNIAKTLPKMAGHVILLAYNGEIDRGVAIEELEENLVREYSLQRITSLHTYIKLGVN
jgi:DNA sulfur modification protein DndD